MFQLLENYLEVEGDEDKFWHSSLNEIVRYMNAYQKRYKAQMENTAYHNYVLAQMVSSFVCGGDRKEIYDFYPSLFNSEEILEAREKAEIARFSAQLRQFAAQHNQKLEANNDN